MSCKDQRKTQPTSTYPVFSESLKQDLLKRCDYIDYIFRDLPISASFGPDQGIPMNINFISNNPVIKMPDQCTSIGRKTFQHRGDIIAEADVVFGAGCMYYLFYENGKVVYASMMTQEGINFYTNIIKSIKQ